MGKPAQLFAIRPWRALELFIFSLLMGNYVNCLFEDQAGTYDWRQQFVGRPISSAIDLAKNKLYLATDQHLLASVNMKTGNIAWRKIFESNENGVVDLAVWGKREIAIVTGKGLRLQSFDYDHGFALWEYTLFNDRAQKVKITGLESTQEAETFYFTNGYQICMANSRDKACADLPSDGGYVYEHLFENDQGISVVGFKQNSIQKVQFNSMLTSIMSKTNPTENGNLKWLDSETNCLKSDDDKYLVCHSTQTNKVYFAEIKATGAIQISETVVDASVKSDDFSAPKLVYASPDTIILETQDQKAKRDYNSSNLFVLKVKGSVTSVSQKIEKVVSFDFNSKENDVFLIAGKYASLNKLNFHIYNVKTGQERTDSVVTLSTNQRDFRSVIRIETSFGTTKSEGQLSLITMCFFEDYSLVLFNSQGVRYFTREESLAYITNVEFVDFPLLHLQEEFEDEFGHSDDDNVVTMFYKRIRSQYVQFKEFLYYDLYYNVLSLIYNNIGNKRAAAGAKASSAAGSSSTFSLSAEEIIRDEFNMNKLIIAVTAIGKVHGLYTNNNGPILWSFYLKNIVPFQVNNNKKEQSMPLFLQRTSAHFPHEPQCTLVAKYNKKQTLVYAFNPITGQVSKDQPKEGIVLDYELKQVFMMSTPNEQFLKPVVLFDQANKLHVIPESSAHKLIDANKKPMVIFASNTENEKANTLVGYAMQSTEKPLPEVWRISLEDEQIAAIGAKLPSDRIHSHGKVLGDRSVLYKYLNPNLIGILTTGQDSQKVPFINLYLVDTVTGAVINSFNHKRCRGPVNIVHSENWFFYSYYNIKYRRNEVVSLELFEGSTQFNSTHFSSFDDIKPVFYTKTYITQKSFDALQVTLTEKGIANKDIIAASQFGILYEIPWLFIDSRRPYRMTDVEREENLIPYMPELPLNYEFSLNYYNYIHNIRAISTAPSGLESTSLVFVYGLDIFFTRVFPSKTFDMLREDFDYFFITTLMVGLLLGTVLSKKLASSNNLNKAWK